MTREELKALLPDGTDDAVVTSILNAMHAEIKTHKDAADTANKALKAKGEDYDTLKAKYDADLKAANDRADNLAFDGELDGVLKAKGCRNVKAARALLDMDALKASKNRQKDMADAADALIGAEDSAMLFTPQPTGEKRDIGAPTGGKISPEAALEAKVRSAMGLAPAKENKNE